MDEFEAFLALNNSVIFLCALGAGIYITKKEAPKWVPIACAVAACVGFFIGALI